MNCGAPFNSFNPSKGFWWISTDSPGFILKIPPLVSIPQRDFGEFQPYVCPSGWYPNVSIPQRDFGEFQQIKKWHRLSRFIVSIPQRDFGEFQRFTPLHKIMKLNRFNPSKGFWWISTALKILPIRIFGDRFNPSKGFWWISTLYGGK